MVVTKAVRPVHYRMALDEASKMLGKICFVLYNNHLLGRAAT